MEKSDLADAVDAGAHGQGRVFGGTGPHGIDDGLMSVQGLGGAVGPAQ
ncbi:hypothetical protein [Streptomyces sp. AcE210]|nr:hypothetical protein [Streptomyces sp. AcE210]